MDGVDWFARCAPRQQRRASSDAPADRGRPWWSCGLFESAGDDDDDDDVVDDHMMMVIMTTSSSSKTITGRHGGGEGDVLDITVIKIVTLAT